MTISKTTINFGKRLGMLVEVCEGDEVVEFDRVWIYLNEDSCEPDVSYTMNQDGSFSFYGCLGLNRSVKEELPGYIADEKSLRRVIKFIHDEVTAGESI